MAKRNKKGGWTGSSAGSNAVKSGGGPQVEKNFSELKKFDPKYTPMQRAIRILLFLLVCILAGSLIYQATPKNMAEYWGVDEQWDAVSKVEITTYDKEDAIIELTGEAELEAFFTALDESQLKRLWFADKESAAFTDSVQIYVDGAEAPAYEMGLVDNRVYLLHMPTYDWYLDETAPLMEYLK